MMSLNLPRILKEATMKGWIADHGRIVPTKMTAT
jgi:hypothetical protein